MTSRKFDSRAAIANRQVKENIPGMYIFEWRICYKQYDVRVTKIPKCSFLDKKISQDDSCGAIKQVQIMKISEKGALDT